MEFTDEEWYAIDLEEFGQELSMVDVGTVIEVGDGIARIHGLSGVGANELLEFDGGVVGMALNLEEDAVGAVIMGDPLAIKEGSEVRGLGRVAESPVGESLLGRVVDGIGRPIDGKGPINTLSLIHICRCRRIERCRSRWSPYHL